jgi:hypothetical protein
MLMRPSNAGPAVCLVPLEPTAPIIMMLQDAEGNTAVLPDEDPVIYVGDQLWLNFHLERRALDCSCAVSGFVFTQPGVSYIKVAWIFWLRSAAS